jgi:hypothetical protein
MNQSALMCCRESLRDLAAYAQYLVDRESAIRVDAVLKRFPSEQRHDQERDAPVLADMVDLDDALILDGGGGPRLAQEALTG